MGKRLCLTFSVYYFVHLYNITALMICQHVFLNIYIFLQKALYSPYCTSNISCIFVGYYKGFSTIYNDTASSWNGRLTNHYIHSFFSDVHFPVYLFIVFVHYIAHFTLILRIKSPAPLQWQNSSCNCINDNPERNRYSRLCLFPRFCTHDSDPSQI